MQPCGDRAGTWNTVRSDPSLGMADHPVIVIGGGPAGLFCAATAAGSGARVLLLEKMPSCGRKLLITGSGQCNLTHEGGIRDFFPRYGDNGAFLRSALGEFTNSDLAGWFREKGLALVTDESGKVFPKSRKASDVLAVLIRACYEAGVTIRTGEAVQGIGMAGGRFLVRTVRAQYRSRALVIATGGASYPSTGSTGDGFVLAESLGHRIAPLAPALVPVRVRDYPFADLAGVSFDGPVLSLHREGQKIRELRGDILFTHSGLSGPGILHLSRYIQPSDTVKVCFLPGWKEDELKADLGKRTATSGSRQVRGILSVYGLPARFVSRLLESAGIPAGLTGAHLTRKARDEILRLLFSYPFVVTHPGGWAEAMVTRGGISLSEVNPKTMESLLVPGLYLAGEVLDIDGDTGGYNLQAAFSTGRAAGRALPRRKK